MTGLSHTCSRMSLLEWWWRERNGRFEERRKITLSEFYMTTSIWARRFCRVNQSSRCLLSTHMTISGNIWVVSGKACVFLHVGPIWAVPARNRLSQKEADELLPHSTQVALDWKRLGLARVVVYQARAHTHVHTRTHAVQGCLCGCMLGVPERRRLPLVLKDARQQPARPAVFDALSHLNPCISW